MCVAIPVQIKDITGIRAQAELAGNVLSISIALVPGVQTGDWVLVHAGCAIAQLNETEARETYEILAEAAQIEEQAE